MMKIKSMTYIKIICFILLLGVAIIVPNNFIDSMTSKALQINSLQFPAKIVSLIFNDKLLLLIMVLLAVFLFYIKEWQKAVFIFFSAGIGGFLLALIKYSVQRTRPLPELHSGYSFPSGHSLFVALFFLALLYVINKKDLVMYIGAFAIILVPLSRLILGAHFLSDVIAGVLLGSIVVDLMEIYHMNIYKIIMKIIGKKDA